MDSTIIKTFFHRHEAEMAKGLLEGNDIPATIKADDAGGHYPNLTVGAGNYKLVVPKTHKSHAKEILQILK